MLKILRDSIQYFYDNQTVTYMQLLVASRKAEAEVVDRKIGTMTIKAKAATTNDKLINLKQQVSHFVAVVKANHVCDSIKKNIQQMTKVMTIKTEEPKYLGLMDILVVQDHQKIISLYNHWEPNLHSSVIFVGDGATWQNNMPYL